MWLTKMALALGSFLTMELVATLVHRWVMHGFGWGWHRSHHEPGHCRLERNDLFAIIFAVSAVVLFMVAARWPLAWWVGFGMSLYGLAYGVLHDGLVHRRLPIRWTPRRGYLARLVRAHRLHHAVHTREGAVSFGFLYAPPVAGLARRLRLRGRGAGR